MTARADLDAAYQRLYDHKHAVYARILPALDADGKPIWEGGLPQSEIDDLLAKLRARFEKWNAFIVRKCEESDEWYAAVWDKCFCNGADGEIFWFDTFVYTHFIHAPATHPNPHVKMVLYPFQEKGIRWIHRHIEARKDGLIEKSRDMGLTWLCTGHASWDWSHDDNANYVFGSFRGELVDGASEDAILPKFDYLIDRMPAKFRDPQYEVNKKPWHLKNMRRHPTTRCEIKGEMTTPNFSRGGRKKGAFLDEYPQWRWAYEAARSAGKACLSKIFLGTPDGRGNEFGRLRFNPENDDDFVLTLHWSEHPEYQSGRYTCGGKGVCQWHEKPSPHSAKYDAICREKYKGNARSIGSEMDIDYTVSGGSMFNAAMTASCIERIETIKPVTRHFSLVYPKVEVVLDSADRMAWFREARKWNVVAKEVDTGPLKVWDLPFSCRDERCLCKGTGAHVYVIGADTARNRAAGDDNAAGMYDVTIGKLAARWKGKCDMAEDFADIIGRMAKWYGVSSGADRNPWIGCEWNDVGLNANEYLNRMNMPLVRTRVRDRLHGGYQDTLGIVTSPTSKPALIDNYLLPYVNKLGDDGLPTVCVLDAEFWRQCETFITHEASTGKVRPERPKMGAQIGEHDDLVMMMAFCLYTAIERHGKVRGYVRQSGIEHWTAKRQRDRTRTTVAA